MIGVGQGFRWTETYSVKVETLDRQHQGLFDIINQLNEALEAGEGASVMNGVIDKLLDYAQNHFAAEEHLMEQHGFPGLSGHQLEHQGFGRTIQKYLDDFRAGKVGAPSALLLFLQSWLKQHILKTDKAYSQYLNERGVR